MPHSSADVDASVDAFADAQSFSLRDDGLDDGDGVVSGHVTDRGLFSSVRRRRCRASASSRRLHHVLEIVASTIQHETLLEQRATVLRQNKQPTHTSISPSNIVVRYKLYCGPKHGATMFDCLHHLQNAQKQFPRLGTVKSWVPQFIPQPNQSIRHLRQSQLALILVFFSTKSAKDTSYHSRYWLPTAWTRPGLLSI